MEVSVRETAPVQRNGLEFQKKQSILTQLPTLPRRDGSARGNHMQPRAGMEQNVQFCTFALQAQRREGFVSIMAAMQCHALAKL